MSGGTPTRSALIVGANQYDDPEIRDLTFAENDCVELWAFLKYAAGFDDVQRLLGGGAASDRVLVTASEMTRKLRPGDLFLFYFAGHGVEHESRHLLLSPKARSAWLRHMQQTVPVDLLREETDTPGLNRVFILDACRSDLLRTRSATSVGLRGEQALRDVVTRAQTHRGAGDAAPGSLAILCSCTEGQQAGEIAGKRHGLFTASLLDVFRVALEAGEELRLSDRLESDLTDRMNRLAREHGLSVGQRPWIQRSGPAPVLLPRADAGPTRFAIVACQTCGQKNRIPDDVRVGEVKCGRCGAVLTPHAAAAPAEAEAPSDVPVAEVADEPNTLVLPTTVATDSTRRLSLALGVRTHGGAFQRLIDPGAELPVRATRNFSTVADNQTRVSVRVFQGLSDRCDQNEAIGSFTLGGIPLAVKGIPQIEVTFDVDARGRLRVGAKDLGTGKRNEVTLNIDSAEKPR